MAHKPNGSPAAGHAGGFAQFAAALAFRPAKVLSGYRRGDLRPDLVAGVTVAAVAIPQAIAYASIAELPPHYGLYAAGVAAVVGSLWGSSRHLATGPVNAVSLLVLPVLLAVDLPGSPRFLLAACVLAVMVGMFNVGLAMLRFGALVTLASRSVLLGFTAGAAVHIAVGQSRHLLGIDVPTMPELYRTAAAISEGIPRAHWPTLALGLSALALTVVLPRLGRRVPGALLAIAATAGAVHLLGLEQAGVSVVGEIPRSLPPPTYVSTRMVPDFELIRALLIGTMAVAALGLVEAVASAQALARSSGHRLDSNQEFFGQGMANIAAGLFTGYPCSGSFTRSALAQQTGGRTQLAGVFTGLAILGGVLVLAPLAHSIPKAAIAGVLLVVAWGMVDRGAIRRVFRTSRSESAVMSVTFAATLALPLDFAVLSGIAFSLAFFVIRSSLPRVYPVVPNARFQHLVEDQQRPVCPQLGILNIRGPLFFGAVYHIEEELRHNHERHPGQHFLMLRMHGVDICDLSGIEMLESTVNTYRGLKGDVFLVRCRRPVLEKLTQSGFIDDTLGRDRLLDNDIAIETLFERIIDTTICMYECEHRVFAECQALEKHVYGDDVPPAPHHSTGHERQVEADVFAELIRTPEAALYDVREPAEYEHGHLSGAKSLPLRELVEQAGELPRDRHLLLACRSGRRTARGLFILEELGFERLHGLRGGILAWRAAGLPTEVESEAPPIVIEGAEPE